MHQKHQRFKRDRICTEIRELIVRENLNIGDRLTAERILARQMDVQRLTIRRAIKQLCKEGILEQRPNCGTFVKKKTGIIYKKESINHIESVFAPTGNILISKPKTVINFVTNDTLPEQQQGWEHIFSKFSEMCPDIKVKHSPPSKISNKHYDCILVRSIDLHRGKFDNVEMVFPETWFSANPQDSFLSEKLITRINDYDKMENGYRSVPLMLSLPALAINMDIIEDYSLKMPPSRKHWKETRKWLKTFDSMEELTPSNLYIHSPLNHLCRVNRKILNSNSINLNYPDVREFLQFLKELWQKSISNSLKGEELLNLSETFIEQKMVSLEIFLHIVPYIRKQSKSNIKVVPSSVTHSGVTQVLPRYLLFGSDREKFFEVLEFSQFLASDEGQNLIAENGFGIPYYNGCYGAKRFCSLFQTDFNDLKKELKNADGFYENTFFKSGFQERIINPMLTNYFNDTLTLDRTIESIKSRTEQLYKLFYMNMNLKVENEKIN